MFVQKQLMPFGKRLQNSLLKIGLRRKWKMLLFVLCTCKTVSAQDLLTIPTDHWAYDYWQQLGLRHRTAGTMLMTLPLRYQQLHAALDSVGPFVQGDAEQFWLKKLTALVDYSDDSYPRLQAGARLVEKAGRLNGDDLHSRLAVRSHLGIFPDRHFALFNVINLDQELRDDPQYIGKRWRGFTGFTEQAYALLHFDKYLAKFGRDFIWWGSGRDATLLL